MSGDVFSELSLIIAIGAGIALLMRVIRQPLIIGHIITGIIVGPTVLHIIQSADTLGVFAKIGIALLLFIIGLGLNPQVIKEVGKVAGIVGCIQVALTTLFGWLAGLVLGLDRTESLFLGIALAFSSTIIILKLLSDKKEQGRLYGKITIGLLLVQDIMATVALFMINAIGDEGLNLAQFAVLALMGLLIGGPLLYIGTKLLPKLHNLIAGSQEFLFLFAIGWGFGSAALFELAGFSIETGALFAGVALASLPYAQEISARLRPLRDFFVIVFFISLGSRLGFANLGSVVPGILLGLLVVVILKPLLVLGMMGVMGYTKRTSFKVAIAMGQVSEFSLVFVILGSEHGFVSDELVTVLTMVALISIAISTYLIMYADSLYTVMERHLNLFERKRSHFERESREHFEMILFGYQKGGHEFVKLFKQLHKKYVVIDYDPEVVDMLAGHKVNYIYGDATDLELLGEIGLERARLIVSTITDHPTTCFLIKHLEKINPHAVVICHSDSPREAAELYELGASYVMIPHYIGSEKISAFIKRNGLKKTEFRRFRDRQLQYLEHFM
jgi:Kef-type K+ transport system membrane component KefB